MQSILLLNQSRQTVVARKLRIADNFFSRLRGLLGTRELPAGEGLLIRPCHSIHMFGMKYGIDVLFVDRQDQVIETITALMPGKTAACPGAEYVVELPCGALAESGTLPGDKLHMLSVLSGQ